MMTERKRALERYRKRAKHKTQHMYFANEWYTTMKHDIRPLRKPRWISHQRVMHISYFDLNDYAVLDKDYARMQILIAPKWMIFLRVPILMYHGYRGALWAIGRYLSNVGYLNTDDSQWPSIRWLIEGRRRAKAKKASQ